MPTPSTMAMKSLLFLLAFTLFGCTASYAGNEPDPGIKDPIHKKNELLGIVMHAVNKKPVTKVNVTAYLVSQKQKTVLSDENGNYSFDDLKPGTYRFIFEKAGFKKVTRENVIVRTDEGALMNVEMEESKSFDLAPSPLHFTDF